MASAAASRDGLSRGPGSTDRINIYDSDSDSEPDGCHTTVNNMIVVHDKEKLWWQWRSLWIAGRWHQGEEIEDERRKRIDKNRTRIRYRKYSIATLSSVVVLGAESYVATHYYYRSERKLSQLHGTNFKSTLNTKIIIIFIFNCLAFVRLYIWAQYTSTVYTLHHISAPTLTCLVGIQCGAT